jgi:secondary thiamine-phosphate synthase enzyme
MKSVLHDSGRGPLAAVEPRSPESAGTLHPLNGLSSNGHSRKNGADTQAEVGAMKVVNELLRIKTGQAPDFLDITERVDEIVRHSGVRTGQALVFSLHTTAAVRVQEAEPLLIEDLTACLERLAPEDLAYRHNDFRVRTVNMHDDESPNGHAHCRHLFLGASETVPIIDGRLALGRWQRLFVIELDHSRRREVQVQVLGLG